MLNFFLSDTIDSVLSQTFQNFELLALDDGSTDSSKNIILSYKDDRIKYISCKHSFIDTCNKGLKLSKGKYIALIDHDDIMMPYRLDIQYRFMEEHPNVDACGGYMHSFGKHKWKMELPLKHDSLIENMLLTYINSYVLPFPYRIPDGFARLRSCILKDNRQAFRTILFVTVYARQVWYNERRCLAIEPQYRCRKHRLAYAGYQVYGRRCRPQSTHACHPVLE